MAKDDPHFRLRIPADLKAGIEKAAREGNRSINAEIVARLEQYPRLLALQPTAAYLKAEKERLEKQVALLEEQNEFLTGTIVEAAKRENDDAQEKGLGNMIEAMREEIAVLSRERGDMDAETARLIREQAEALEKLQETNRLTADLLRLFRDAFFEATDGDGSALEDLIRKRLKPKGAE